MGWFDRIGYNIAPLFGPVGRGISDAMQDTRTADVARQINAANNLQDFAQVQTPDNIYDPTKMTALENMRRAKLLELQQQQAAPVAKMLSRFAAEGNDADPNFTGAEWIRGMATTGPNAPYTEEQYDAMLSGAVPGGKKGAAPLSSFEANPITAKMLQDAELNAQQKAGLARTFDRRGTPMDLASLAMNKDVASGFDNTTQGTKRIADMALSDDQVRAQAAMNQIIAGNPLPKNIDEWKALETSLRSVPGAEIKLVNETLKELSDRLSTPSGSIPLSAKSGNATASGSVQTDMFGRPIGETKLTVTNHPRQPAAPGTSFFDKQNVKDFQNDLTYKRQLERLVATGGKGMLMINGIPTSFDGTKESVDALTGMLADQEEMMRETYPELMKKRSPKTPGALVKKPEAKTPGKFKRESPTMKGYWQDANGNWWDPGTKRP